MCLPSLNIISASLSYSEDLGESGKRTVTIRLRQKPFSTHHSYFRTHIVQLILFWIDNAQGHQGKKEVKKKYL